MAKGDQVRVTRWLGPIPYDHHGIDMGDGTVIHLDGYPLTRDSAHVRRVSHAEFLRGGRMVMEKHAKALPPEQVTQRAQDALGPRSYDLLRHNCEHFASWCKTGHARSRQVEYGTFVAVAVGISLPAAILVHRQMTRKAINPT